MRKIIFILILFFPSLAWSYTVTANRPRIWFNSSDVSAMQTRCTTVGQAKTEYDRLKAWVDAHISDDISTIALTSQCKDESPVGDSHMGIHLLRTAFVYVISGTASYGQRVADLLYWLSQNGTSPYGTTAIGSDPACGTYFALGAAFDWAYAALDYNSHLSDVITYLDTINSSGVDNDVIKAYSHGSYVYYKTEEPYHLGFLALALYGESGIDSTDVNECISRFGHYLKHNGGTYDETGFDGGLCFTGSYFYTQAIHRMVFFEAWRTATDEDPWITTEMTNGSDGTTEYAGNYTGSDNFRFLGDWMLWTMRPDGELPYWGDSNLYTWDSEGVWYPTLLFLIANRYDDAQAQYAYELIETNNPDFNRTAWLDDRLTQDLFFCMWHDPSQSASVPSVEAKLFDGIDSVVMRDSFAYSGSGIVMFTASLKKHDYGHWSADNGSFILVRNSDALLVGGGYYLWGDQTHYDNYHSKPWAYNTIIVDDADYRFGISQAGGFTTYSRSYTPQESNNDFGSVTKFGESKDNYAFAVLDLTDAYNTAEIDDVKRHIVFIDDRYFIFYDRIEKDTAADYAKLLFHTQNEPVRASDDWDDVGVDCYDDKTTGTPVVSWTVGGSKAHLELISPMSSITMRQVGGADCEYCNMSYAQQETSESAHAETGDWRFEIFSTASNSTDAYLYTIEPTASAGSQQTTNTIGTIDADFIGVEIRATTRCAVLFPVDGAADEVLASFTVSDTSGTLKAIVYGLMSGVYTVNGSGNYSVDSDGILYFSADLSVVNSFVIAQGGSTMNQTGTPATFNQTGTAAVFNQ